MRITKSKIQSLLKSAKNASLYGYDFKLEFTKEFQPEVAECILLDWLDSHAILQELKNLCTCMEQVYSKKSKLHKESCIYTQVTRTINKYIDYNN